MTAPLPQVWRSLPLSALERASSRAMPELAARWGEHPRFWSRLLEAAAPANRSRVVSVRQLGLQLLAAEGIRAQERRAEARSGRN